MSPHAAHFFHKALPFTFIVAQPRPRCAHPTHATSLRALPLCHWRRANDGPITPIVGAGHPRNVLVESDPVLIRWITATTSQRAVTMEDRTPTPTIVCDFRADTSTDAGVREAGTTEYYPFRSFVFFPFKDLRTALHLLVGKTDGKTDGVLGWPNRPVSGLGVCKEGRRHGDGRIASASLFSETPGPPTCACRT